MTTKWQKVVGILGLVVVLWVGDRLADVIRSGGVRAGGDHQPAGRTPTSQPTATGNPTLGSDGGGDGHDPSRFGH